MFRSNTCAVFTWDKDGNVSGILLKKISRNSFDLLKAELVSAQSASLAANLQKASQSLSLNNEEFNIIIGGYIPGAVCIEVKLPALPASELEQVLSFELQRYLPYPLEDLIWTFRIIEDGAANQKPSRVRLLAVTRKEWNKLLSEIASSGLKADAVISPYMALDPLLEGYDFNPEGFETGFTFQSKDSSGLRHMLPEDKEGRGNVPDQLFEEIKNIDLLEKFGDRGKERFASSFICGIYALSDDFRKDNPFTLSLPKELVPQRFRFQRVAAIFLTVGIGLLCAGLLFRYWYKTSERVNAINREQKKIVCKLHELNKDIENYNKEGELIEKLQELQKADSKLLATLHFLSESLPPHMWVTSFSLRGERIALTIKATQEKDDISSILARTKLFSLESMRRTRTADGKVYFYLNLAFK